MVSSYFSHNPVSQINQVQDFYNIIVEVAVGLLDYFGISKTLILNILR
jgi:hypothetical protein